MTLGTPQQSEYGHVEVSAEEGPLLKSIDNHLLDAAQESVRNALGVNFLTHQIEMSRSYTDKIMHITIQVEGALSSVSESAVERSVHDQLQSILLEYGYTITKVTLFK